MINFLSTTPVDWSLIWVITAVGYLVVFFALVILIFVYKSLPVILKIQTRPKKKKTGDQTDAGASTDSYISGEVNAAIGMALVLYFNEQHDEESHIITIKRVARTYSPWSSKIYGTSANVLPSGRR